MASVTILAMTKRHPRWAEFIEMLEGPMGCNFKESVPGDINSTTWDCSGLDDFKRTRAILTNMGLDAVATAKSIEYFEKHSGWCDCEVLFNVA
jgi:hypothetical protein